jgi:hypothetical protein
VGIPVHPPFYRQVVQELVGVAGADLQPFADEIASNLFYAGFDEPKYQLCLLGAKRSDFLCAGTMHDNYRLSNYLTL